MGYGLLDVHGSEARYLAAGAITARASMTVGTRLSRLRVELLRLIQCWKPDLMAVEEPFVPVEGLGGGYRTSVRSAIVVGQAQAVALMAAADHDLPVFRYAPAQVKSLVAGYGRGGKAQVAEVVRMILGLQEPPTPSDASDALAVALCHVQVERARALERG